MYSRASPVAASVVGTTEAQLCFAFLHFHPPKITNGAELCDHCKRDQNISVSAAYSLYFTASRTPRWLAAMATSHGRQTSVGRGCLVLQASLFGPGCCSSKALGPESDTKKYAPNRTLLPRKPSRTRGVHPRDEYKVAGLRVASLLPFTASPSIHAPIFTCTVQASCFKHTCPCKTQVLCIDTP